MTPQEHVATKFSHYNELSLKYKTQAELPVNLKISSIYMSVVKGKRVGDIRDNGHENLISLRKITSKERVKVCMSNSKETSEGIMVAQIYGHIQGYMYLFHILRTRE